VAEFDSAIPPGGKGKVVAKVHTRGYQGKRTKTVRVTTNDPANPQVTLRMTFTVQSPVEVWPSRRPSLSVLQGQPGKLVLVLHRPDGKPLEVKEAFSNRPRLRVRVEKVTGENADPEGKRYGARPGDWRLFVELPDTSRPLSETATVKVETNHPDRPEVSIPVRLRVRPLVQPVPRALYVRLQPGRDRATARVTLTHGARKPFRVTGAELVGQFPGASVRVVSAKPGGSQVLEVVVAGRDLPAGTYRGRVVAHTDLAQAPSVEVPLSVQVPAPADSGR